MRDFYIRNVSEDVCDRFDESAGARRMSRAGYFVALVRLHERLGKVLDSHPRGLDEIRELVDGLGLTSKTR